MNDETRGGGDGCSPPRPSASDASLAQVRVTRPDPLVELLFGLFRWSLFGVSLALCFFVVLFGLKVAVEVIF